MPPEQPACPGANNRVVHCASLNQQLVNWILWHTVKFTVFGAALPLSASQQSPQIDQEAQQHLAPLLLIYRQEANLNKSVCAAIVFHVRQKPCLYIKVFYTSNTMLLLHLLWFVIYVSGAALNLFHHLVRFSVPLTASVFFCWSFFALFKAYYWR